MMENLPEYIYWLFAAATLLAVVLFYRASGKDHLTLRLIRAWLVVQSIVAIPGFYLKTDSMPPRFALLVLPPVLLIISQFFTERGRRYMDSFDLRSLTLFHIVRAPVELVLFLLFVNKAVPQLMTFEGRNFDILVGLTAPLVALNSFVNGQPRRNLLLIWNIAGLGLLINIVANGILSVRSPFQQFAFEQPNEAVLYFPFMWLPGCIVPLALFSHLIAIRKLTASA